VVLCYRATQESSRRTSIQESQSIPQHSLSFRRSRDNNPLRICDHIRRFPLSIALACWIPRFSQIRVKSNIRLVSRMWNLRFCVFWVIGMAKLNEYSSLLSILICHGRITRFRWRLGLHPQRSAHKLSDAVKVPSQSVLHPVRHTEMHHS
jgi:hypothetical protein